MPLDGPRKSSSANLCVLVCRDCCCGTVRKHPDVDHAAQEEALRAAAAEGGGRLIRTKCLGVCERSNVIVVKGASTTFWFGGVLAPKQTEAVLAFIRSGARSAAPLDVSFSVGARRVPVPDPYPCALAPVTLPV